MLSAEVNDLQVEFIPGLLGKEALEILLGLLDRFPVGQAPSLGQTVNMGINRKGWDTEGLGHDHLCGLVAHARESLQGLEAIGNLTGMLLDQNLRQPVDRPGFLRTKPARTDDLENPVLTQLGHVPGIIRQIEEFRRYLVHTFVRTLGTQEDGNQQCIGILMIQWNRGFRISGVQTL